jgi:UDPglucose--hexose-1-phosphate uridylyltransferase
MRQSICPFCPDKLQSPILYKVGEPWRIAVIPNKYPAVDHDAAPRTREGFFQSTSGFGFHEVIIDHPEHVRFDELTEEHLQDLLGVYAQRTKTHMADDRIKYVSIFRNDGAVSGASIAHIHSQVVALPVVPRTIYKERAKIDEYLHMFGECPFEMIYKEEKKEGRRFLMENQTFFAVAPFASVFPGETWIIAKRHVRSLPDLGKRELEDLASVLKTSIGAIVKLFPGVPYNMVVHQAPRGRDFHFHIEIYPRLTKFGGFELANDMYINILLPETFANDFRKVIK